MTDKVKTILTYLKSARYIEIDEIELDQRYVSENSNDKIVFIGYAHDYDMGFTYEFTEESLDNASINNNVIAAKDEMSDEIVYIYLFSLTPLEIRFNS